MPGDTLAVKFTRIRLNRDSARSGSRIVPGAVQPGYYRNAKFDDNFDSGWKLDLRKPDRLTRQTQRASQKLPHPAPAHARLRRRRAPANQSFRTGWLGSWGGNIDYNGVREGVTVYLPVYQEGAHPLRRRRPCPSGDGELTGDALETSMDVEFTVDLIRGRSTQAPRFENDEYLMASGIANSLQDALQMATTQLANWLQRDYKLSANESNVILGAACSTRSPRSWIPRCTSSPRSGSPFWPALLVSGPTEHAPSP